MGVSGFSKEKRVQMGRWRPIKPVSLSRDIVSVMVLTMMKYFFCENGQIHSNYACDSGIPGLWNLVNGCQNSISKWKAG